jgi:hypothetical protein
MYGYGVMVEKWLTGQNKSIQRKTGPHTTLPTTNIKWGCGNESWVPAASSQCINGLSCGIARAYEIRNHGVVCCYHSLIFTVYMASVYKIINKLKVQCRIIFIIPLNCYGRNYIYIQHKKLVINISRTCVSRMFSKKKSPKEITRGQVLVET